MSLGMNETQQRSVEEFRRLARHGFRLREKNGLAFYTIPQLDETGRFTCIFTTRNGGVSTDEFASLNLSVTREQNPENKKINYLRAADAAGVVPDSLVLVNYAHGTGIERVSPQNCGEGLSRPATFPHCDALIVDEPGVTAVTLHADCVPLFVADPSRRIGAVAHAGWKGTVAGLPGKLIRVFEETFGSAPAELLCAVGPHIRSCCFEVGQDVAGQFSAEFGLQTVVEMGPDERPHVDLEAAILVQLAETGVLPGNVTLSDECTSCCEQQFYSHRRDRGRTGAMASMLAVLPDA